MSVEPDTSEPRGASAPVRVRAARSRADARLSGAIADYFLADSDRLDDRTRAMIARLLNALIEGLAFDIRRHAARLLATRGAPALGEAVLKARGDIAQRLTRAGLLRDRALMDELIARVRQDLLGDALPSAVGGPDEASLLVRLIEGPDTIVAATASALLAAQSRRRSANIGGTVAPNELPAELHHRLVWWVAAALRSDDDGAVDHALAEAAQRSLGAHDEGERVEAVAMRLAAAIDAAPEELAMLLTDSLGDRQPALFAALLGHALGYDYDAVRALMIEPEGERLWLALRAVACGRETLARVALALSEADPRRDIEAFADALDDIAAVDPHVARMALGPLALHRDFREAIDSLARCETP
ncbi:MULTISPECIES: DUF2336 domain-containing protein [unclassified Sphingomonas]|uniref:DUF2336 domain-containing protein n=1 Tax=unclassified Sphingomonas TaxID=196159 RepID=UPI002269FCD9|nr:MULTISPECIES: DUF2336 domain-containing protein [unclassified Sphingomonas]